MTTNLKMPKTKTPKSVFVILGVFTTLAYILLAWLLGELWGLIVMFVILGITTGTYTETVEGFDARIVLNYWTGVQRTLFQGLNFKLFWEGVQDEKIDLKTDLKEVVEQTWQSKDAMMDTTYIYTIRPDYSGDDAGEKIIIFASYEHDAIRMEGRALFSMLFSDYYRERSFDNLTNKEKINEEIFRKDGAGGTGRVKLEKFEKEHGVEVIVRLEDSDVDAETQKSRDIVAKSESFTEAVDKLMKGKDGKRRMKRPEAEKVAKMMNIPGVTEHIVTLKIDGVPNLRDVTLLPPGLGGKK